MNVAFTINGASVFGRMCFQMIFGTRVPDAMAASTIWLLAQAQHDAADQA